MLGRRVREVRSWRQLTLREVAGLAGLSLHAGQVAPQLIRCNVFVRETVADLLRQARRDAGGRELRGLPWRMGAAPTG